MRFYVSLNSLRAVAVSTVLGAVYASVPSVTSTDETTTFKLAACQDLSSGGPVLFNGENHEISV